MDKIYIVIPVLDRWNETKMCLDALRASSYRELEIMVVNHSTDPTIGGALLAGYPEVVQIRGDATLWWAGATNLGVRAAMDRGAKKVMLLNHDCYVEPETIERVAAHASRVGEAMIAPVPFDYFTKRVLAVTAATCFLLGFPTITLTGKAKYLGQSKLLPTKLILGGRGVLIPTSIFRRYGLFDEVNLPSYYSDHDFYLRCRSHGVPLLVAADARVYVDDTRTSVAAKAGDMSARQFLQTLFTPRSHRNIRDLTTIFKFYYPIKRLHHLGVALHLFRYFAIYLCRRIGRLARRLGG